MRAKARHTRIDRGLRVLQDAMPANAPAALRRAVEDLKTQVAGIREQESVMASITHRLGTRLKNRARTPSDQQLARESLAWLKERGLMQVMQQENRDLDLPLHAPSAQAAPR